MPWQLRQLADLDRDGNVDILWQESTLGDLYVWLMDDLAVTSGSYLTPRGQADLTWQIVPR